MSAKNIDIPAGQPALFEGFHFDPREYSQPETYIPWTEYGDAKKVAMVMSPEKGAHVDIEARDSALLRTLGHLAHASMMIGLQKVAESKPDSPLRGGVEARYGSEAHAVLDAAPTVQMEKERAAREAFTEAYGYKSLVDHGSRPVDVSESFVDEFDRFQDLHYGSRGNANRNKLKKQIIKNQEISNNTRYVRRGVQRSSPKQTAA